VRALSRPLSTQRLSLARRIGRRRSCAALLVKSHANLTRAVPAIQVRGALAHRRRRSFEGTNEASITRRSSTRALPLAQFPGVLPFVAAEFGEQRDHARVDAGHQPVGSFPLQSRTSNPLAPPARSAMSAPRWSRIRSRRARSRSQRLERRDARVEAADFQRDRTREKCSLQLADP
jgi:hypothetical protein